MKITNFAKISVTTAGTCVQKWLKQLLNREVGTELKKTGYSTIKSKY